MSSSSSSSEYSAAISSSTLSRLSSASSSTSSSSSAPSSGMPLGLNHWKWLARRASSDSRSRTKIACSPWPCFSLLGAKSTVTPIFLRLSRMLEMVELGSSNSCGCSNCWPAFRHNQAANDVKT